MSSRRLIFCAALLLPFLAGCGKDKGKPTFDPPAGWKAKEVAGLKDPAYIGPESDAFAPNINMVEENFSGKIEAYADASLKQLEKQFPGIKVVSRSAFTTTSGEAGVRIVTENRFAGKLLRQTFYTFDGGSKKYVLTCSQSAGGQNHDTIFEDSMKTFRFSK